MSKAAAKTRYRKEFYEREKASNNCPTTAMSICGVALLSIENNIATLIFGQAKIAVPFVREDKLTYCLGGSVYVALHKSARLNVTGCPIINTITCGSCKVIFMHRMHVRIDDKDSTKHYPAHDYLRGIKKFERILHDHCGRLPPN